MRLLAFAMIVEQGEECYCFGNEEKGRKKMISK